MEQLRPARPAPAARWLVPALAVCAVLALPALWGRALLFRDLVHFTLPQQAFAAAARAAGRLPLWDPGRYGGAPFLAEPGTGVFYPGNLIFHLLPPLQAATAFVLLHLPLAALGAFRLACRLGAPPPGAGLAAAGFCASGYLLSMQGGHYYLASAALLPLCASGLLGAALAPAGRSVALAALPVAALLLGGELQALAFAAALALLLAPVCGARLRGLGALAAALALGGLLGAPQLLPTLAFARGTVRAGGLPLAELQSWSLHPLRALELLVPAPLGLPWPESGYWGAGLAGAGRGLPWAVSLFLGPPLLLAAACARSGRALALAAAALVALLLAFGSHLPLHALAVRALPLADRFRYPEKYALVTTLALCLLAGLGAERLRARGALQGALLLGIALLAAAAACTSGPAPLQEILEAGLSRSGANLPVEAAQAALALSLAHGAAAALAVAGLGAAARRRRELWSPGLVALACASLASAGAPLLSWGDPAALAGEPPYAAAWRALPAAGTQRVLADGSCGYRGGGSGPLLERVRAWDHAVGKENLPTLLGLREALGYGAAESRAQVDLFRRLLPAGLPLAARRIGAAAISSCRGGGLEIAPLEGALPRVRLVPGRTATPAGVAAALLDPAFDPLREALLEGAAAPAPGPGAAQVTEDAPERVVVHAGGPGGALVLADAFAPGWSARIDGAPAEVLRADGWFRAVIVPPGPHTVVFEYRAPGLAAGLWLGGLGALLALGLGLRRGGAPIAA